jgi:polar amino acid transport system substrate-binding protein
MNYFKRFRYFGRMLGATALCLTAWSARADTVTVFGGDSFAPTTFIANGEPAGTLVDLLKQLSSKTGDEYLVRLLPWKRAYEAALRGEGAIMGLSRTGERRELFEFSEPLHYNDLQLVVHKDRPFVFKRLSDLKGKNIGGGLGVSYGDAVDTALQQGLFSMERDTDATESVFKVLQGRLDAAVIGHGMPGYEAVVTSNPRLVARLGELAVLPHPLERDPLYFAMRKTMGQQDAVARLNKALRELHLVAAAKSRP